MEKVKHKCKVEYCEKDARNRGLCGSCLSLTRLRIKQGKLTPEQAQLLLNPKIRQGPKQNGRFDEWVAKTLAQVQTNAG